jgi:hypothetical protein
VSQDLAAQSGALAPLKLPNKVLPNMDGPWQALELRVMRVSNADHQERASDAAALGSGISDATWQSSRHSHEFRPSGT